MPNTIKKKDVLSVLECMRAEVPISYTFIADDKKTTLSTECLEDLGPFALFQYDFSCQDMHLGMKIRVKYYLPNVLRQRLELEDKEGKYVFEIKGFTSDEYEINILLKEIAIYDPTNKCVKRVKLLEREYTKLSQDDWIRVFRCGMCDQFFGRWTGYLKNLYDAINDKKVILEKNVYSTDESYENWYLMACAVDNDLPVNVQCFCFTYYRFTYLEIARVTFGEDCSVRIRGDLPVDEEKLKSNNAKISLKWLDAWGKYLVNGYDYCRYAILYFIEEIEKNKIF